MTTLRDWTIAELRAEARELWGRSSAFRVGILVGRRSLRITNPYSNPRGQHCFDLGVERGRENPEGLS